MCCLSSSRSVRCISCGLLSCVGFVLKNMVVIWLFVLCWCLSLKNVCLFVVVCCMNLFGVLVVSSYLVVSSCLYELCWLIFVNLFGFLLGLGSVLVSGFIVSVSCFIYGSSVVVILLISGVSVWC